MVTLPGQQYSALYVRLRRPIEDLGKAEGRKEEETKNRCVRKRMYYVHQASST